jgi:hypothetical protein
LGIDPERFVAAYEFAVSGEAQAQALASAQSGSTTALASVVKWVALGIVGLGLTGAAAAVWRRAPEVPTTSLGQVAAYPSSSSPTDAVPGVPSPFVEGELAVESPGSAIVRLTLTVNEPCWLEVSTDGERVAEGIMLRGFEKEFRAEEICLSLGNAGGVSYRIDDRVGKPLGQPGQVIKGVCVTRDNLPDFVDGQEEGSRIG